jgi:hypothetical protein
MVTNGQQSPPRPRRWKNLPPRDEHGELRVVITYRPATSALDRQRFDDLARRLYRRWVLEEKDATSSWPSAPPASITSRSPSSPAVA